MKLRNRLKAERGITLVALIITIIILIILAAVSLRVALGDKLLDTAVEGVTEYTEQSAREQLEFALAQITPLKVTDRENYDSEDYLTDRLIEQGIGVVGDIAIVGGYEFEIDREKLAVVDGLGQSNRPNTAPVLVSVEEYERRPNSISLRVVATDADNDKIRYITEIGESEEGLAKHNNTVSTAEDGSTIVTIAELKEYTDYYIRITASDGRITSETTKIQKKTKCSGIGETICKEFPICDMCDTNGKCLHKKPRTSSGVSHTMNVTCVFCGNTQSIQGGNNAIVCDNCGLYKNETYWLENGNWHKTSCKAYGAVLYVRASGDEGYGSTVTVGNYGYYKSYQEFLTSKQPSGGKQCKKCKGLHYLACVHGELEEHKTCLHNQVSEHD